MIKAFFYFFVLFPLTLVNARATDIYENDSSATISNQAIATYYQLTENTTKKDSIALIIDFSLPSNQKRFFIVDLTSNTIIYQDYVSHGKNSGQLYANSFSNTPNSYKSSLGLYKVQESYFGKHGLSFRLEGDEKGINNNARKRAIVLHAANYMTQEFITKYGRAGRSHGCPAFSPKSFEQIKVHLLPNTPLFIYHPSYLK